MKKIKILSFALVLLLSTGLLACNSANKIEPKAFVDWASAEGRTSKTVEFKDDENSRPSESEIKTIARAISINSDSQSSSDCMCVALTDLEQQTDVVGNKANNGTVTLLVFGKKASGLSATDSSNGYYGAGIASGHANLAAISLGYGASFHTVTSYNDALGGTTVEEVYLKDKDYQYTDLDGTTYDAYDNMQFVCAIVVGTPQKNQTEEPKREAGKNLFMAKEGTLSADRARTMDRAKKGLDDMADDGKELIDDGKSAIENRMNDFWRDGRYEGTDNGFYDDNDGENSDDSSQGSAKNGMSRDRVNDGKGLFDRIRDSVDDRDEGDINESDDSRNREVDGEIVDDGSGNNPDGDTRVIVGDNNITPPPPNVDQIVPFAIDFAK